MKKLLAIVVLGLMLSGNAYAAKLIKDKLISSDQVTTEIFISYQSSFFQRIF